MLWVRLRPDKLCCAPRPPCAGSNLCAVASSMCAFMSACTSMCSCRLSGGSGRSAEGLRKATRPHGRRGSELTQCASTTGGSIHGLCAEARSSHESTIGEAGMTPRSVKKPCSSWRSWGPLSMRTMPVITPVRWPRAHRGSRKLAADTWVWRPTAGVYTLAKASQHSPIMSGLSTPAEAESVDGARHGSRTHHTRMCSESATKFDEVVDRRTSRSALSSNSPASSTPLPVFPRRRVISRWNSAGSTVAWSRSPCANSEEHVCTSTDV
mmetsp:Transcript_14289/g.38518  ORF Transcript_14289/g.38518 Transcript_14289/m.38518 type:complete len:267 (+) Transcript_14289:2973-3773(+)